MNVFFSNYHIAVNEGLVDDLVAAGATVLMPKDSWGKISFFAPNDEHQGKQGVVLISYEEFLSIDKLAILIPCTQMLDDFQRLALERNKGDKIILLTALSTSLNDFPHDLTDYVLSHDIYYHRATKAKHKMLYFSRPKIIIPDDKDYRRCFDQKQIKLYINNFTKEGFEPELVEAEKFRAQWIEKHNLMVPFFGYGNTENSWLSQEMTQTNMKDSMFTLVFKRRETWGQMVNESMLLGTPCVFLRQFMNSTLKYYEITEDNSIIGDTVEDLIEKIESLSFEQYESMCEATRAIARMHTADEPRRTQLRWFLSKLED